MTIFYYGYEANYVNEQTQVRMEEMIKCGATLSPTYNRQTVTHVVVSRLAKETTGNADTVNLRQALGIKKWDELPDHVPVIFWEWVRRVIGGEKNPPYWDDCAIFDRFDACAPKANTRAMELRKKQALWVDHCSPLVFSLLPPGNAVDRRLSQILKMRAHCVIDLVRARRHLLVRLQSQLRLRQESRWKKQKMS